MLTESFVASVLSSGKGPADAARKDVGIVLHTYQPLPAQKSAFKKSSSPPNCLAVSDSHIFAAQAEKAVVHVYSRERGNQEAVVPFPEKISSLTLVGRRDGPGVLVMGTEGGRLLMWELCTGRQVSSAPAHLQAITCLAADTTFNFVLSGSDDSNLQVWSVPQLLSFSTSQSNDPSEPLPFSPVQTLSNHRAAITAVVTGSSSTSVDIAISASRDETCIVWEYRSGTLLHTFLLPSTPLCLSLDPAERGFYAGFSDGSVQMIDFMEPGALTNRIHDPSLSAIPTQPPPSERWQPESESAVLCMAISYAADTLITGHENGKICAWDIRSGSSHPVVDYSPMAVTNIEMLPPIGFPATPQPALKILTVVKPRYESFLDGRSLAAAPTASSIPESYTFTAQFSQPLSLPRFSTSEPTPVDNLMSSFDAALAHPCFPSSLLEEGIAALNSNTDPPSKSTPTPTPTEETTLLRAQLAEAQATQRSQAESLKVLSRDVAWHRDEARLKAAAKRRRRLRMVAAAEMMRRTAMGETVATEEDDMDAGEEEEVSSTTDEMSD